MHGNSSIAAVQPQYVIRFPDIDQHEDQDSEFCEIEAGGIRRTIRLHDYDEIYKSPGLYEQLFYERLKCASPQQVVSLLSQTMRDRGIDPSTMNAIDVGAGNGMVGEELRDAGCGPMVGIDILPEAQMAAMRDRPNVYRDYVVADLTDLTDAEQSRLSAHDPSLLVTVAALGFGDIPPRAFAVAFNLIRPGGLLAFNIRDSFLNARDRTGFSKLINDMSCGGIIQIESWKRYVHRLTVHGKPIEYIAIIARKHSNVPESMLEAEPASAGGGGAKVKRPVHIEYKGVSKRYEGAASEALIDFNVTVGSGELLALVGGSGSGKTTAIKLINRLIEPTTGTVLVNNTDVKCEDAVHLRRRIGYAFQQIGLFPHMTVGENVATTPKLLGWSPEDVSARVDELLKLVGLPAGEFRLRRVQELSGGQQQRVGFARALAAKPSIMLLDEPFGALDPITREQLQVEYLLIHRQLGLTSVLVTHDMTEALLLADRIAVMRSGRLVQVGTPEELIDRPADDYVASLLSTPRRQAERLKELSHHSEHASMFDNERKMNK